MILNKLDSDFVVAFRAIFDGLCADYKIKFQNFIQTKKPPRSAGAYKLDLFSLAEFSRLRRIIPRSCQF